MKRHLNLVESDFEHLEKKVLPRFPFCFLTFKCPENKEHVFEVKDISKSGMQLGLKSDEHKLKESMNITGEIHWGARKLDISGLVKWNTPLRLGVEFTSKVSERNKIDEFLDLSFAAKMMRPIHKLDYGVELPVNLKYWARADGPIETFVWQHSSGELAKFQIIMMEHFVEWEAIKGLVTARVISKRSVDSPLLNEDEFVFRIDDELDYDKIKKAQHLISHIEPEVLTPSVVDFIKLKLGSHT